MRGVHDPATKAECIRLRVEDRKSLREIHDQTGVSKGSLSKWLRDHPLSDEEKEARRRSQNRYRAPKKDRGEESALHHMIGSQKLSRLQKAKVAESAALLRMCIFDLNVFGSVFDGDKTDWLVESREGKVLKVQVKWAEDPRPHGLPTVSLRHSWKKRTYQDGDFDFIVGYDLFTDTAYVWSWAEVAHLKTSITVRPEAAERWDKLLSP